MDIRSYETFSTLINFKQLHFPSSIRPLGAWTSPPLLMRPLGLCTQAFQQDILITFVNTVCFNYLCKQFVMFVCFTFVSSVINLT